MENFEEKMNEELLNNEEVETSVEENDVVYETLVPCEETPKKKGFVDNVKEHVNDTILIGGGIALGVALAKPIGRLFNKVKTGIKNKFGKKQTEEVIETTAEEIKEE